MRQLASNAVRSPSTQWRRSIVCSSSCVRECNGVSFNPRLLRTYQSSSILVDGFKQASSRMPTRLSSSSMLAPILPRITLWTQPTSRTPLVVMALGATPLRAHKSDGAACPLLAQLGEKACDRDALASLNMVSCALCSLDGRGRPGHLCRTRFSNCEH